MVDQYLPTQKIQRIIDGQVDKKRVFGTVISISKNNHQLKLASGNLDTNSYYFLASVTKLYITAIILKLRSDKKINPEDPIIGYLSYDTMKDLHIYNLEDFSSKITIKHLLSNTSGLPDYFEEKQKNGTSLKKELIRGNDHKWTFKDVMHISKTMKPHFIPGTPGKAYYSDTNFQLLGKIIESVTDLPLSQALQTYLFAPLHLIQTYLFEDPRDNRPAMLYYKDKPLHIPEAMTSFWADGSLVATAQDNLTFLKAFFNGSIFPDKYLNELYFWNKIFFPFQYGVGIARFKLPLVFSPIKPMPELIGHPASTGAFAYFCPERNLFITGTVNQISNPGLPYKLILKILNTIG